MTERAWSNLQGIVLRADKVPTVTIGEQPARGSGQIPQASLSTTSMPDEPGSARPVVAIANPKVAILALAKMP